MRYAKGSIQLNEARDLPLLRQILRSEFATHSQLFEFMRLEHYEQNRKSFDWRLRRLVNRGLVVRHQAAVCMDEALYSIAHCAEHLLQGMGECCLVGRRRPGEKGIGLTYQHAIDLNDIHLTALRAGVLVRWTGALEIRSRNELTEIGFAKDYDAIVTVGTETGEHGFALEYERSAKTIERYRKVAASLSRETQVSPVLYLVASYDLQRFVSGALRGAQCRVFFGLVKDWHKSLLDMSVTSSSSFSHIRLKEALCGAPAKPVPTLISR
jgi:hypothetical protein